MSLITRINRLAGTEDLDKCIRLFTEEKLIVPEKFGSLGNPSAFAEKGPDAMLQQVENYLRQKPSVLIYGKGKRYIDIKKPAAEENPFLSYFSYDNDGKEEKKIYTDVFDALIAEAMVTIGGAITFSHTEDAYDHYSYRMEQDGAFKKRIKHIKHIGEGITFPAWKTWYGKSYIDTITRGKLLSAPCFYKKEYKEVILVCLYEKPQEWNSPQNLEMVSAYKKYVGEDYFFDIANPERSLKTPFK